MTTTLIGAPGLEKTSPRFRAKLIEIASDLGLSADSLAVVMSFETGGTFDPAQKNLAGSGATGLIQFMPETAAFLGTSTEQLAAMSTTDQLAYVAEYYDAVGPSRISSALDHYLAVFSPAFIGKPKETPMYSAPSKAYEQNAGLDADGDGVITVGDVGKKFVGFFATADARPRIVVDDGNVSKGGTDLAVGIVALGITIFSLASMRASARRV